MLRIVWNGSPEDAVHYRYKQVKTMKSSSSQIDAMIAAAGLLVSLLACLGCNGDASSFGSGYVYNHEESGITISSSFGDPSNLEIPDRLDGAPVVKIGEAAFRPFAFMENSTISENTTLKIVTLPDTVEEIGDQAFMGCAALREFSLPRNLTVLGEKAFLGCRSLETIVVPSGVTAIPNGAFSSCKKLKKVVLPGELVSIGDAAFENCESLESIVLPEGVTKLGENAFCGCTNLVSVEKYRRLGVLWLSKARKAQSSGRSLLHRTEGVWLLHES